MGSELPFERCEDPADEQVVAVPWEGIVGEEQEAIVVQPGIQSAMVATEEVGDVVGYHRPSFLRREVEQDAVVNGAQMILRGVLDGDHVMPTIA
jgi:hypothetical protein